MVRVLWLPAVALLLCGCTREELRRNSTSLFDGIPVDTTNSPPAPLEVTTRVHEACDALVSQTPFLGVTPVVYAIGSKDVAIYHPSSDGLMISQGLVESCKTDDELSAVLALELGKMSSEARAARRMRLTEPMKPLPGASSSLGSQPDENQLRAEMIFREQAKPNQKASGPSEDPNEIAEEILQNAGLPKELLTEARVKLAKASRNQKTQPTMTPSTPPQWTR
ncbi:MAG: hypothetical protein ACRC8S_22340 [Fimbriiglobus sp.]